MILISQSLSKELGLYVIEDNIESVPICPKRVYHTSIKRDEEYPPSDPMMEGLFGETLCIGSGAHGQVLTDLPRKKLTKKMINENIILKQKELPLIKGEKKIAQLRIENQANRFPMLCTKYELSVIKGGNTQVPLIVHYRDDFFISVNIDIFPTPVLHNGQLWFAMVDLKFTSDVNNDFFDRNQIGSTSVSCYGKPEYLAKNQPLFYNYAVRNFTEANFQLTIAKYPLEKKRLRDIFTETVIKMIPKVNFFWFVLGYKKDVTEDDGQEKVIKFRWDDTREDLFHDLMNTTIAVYNHYDAKGWPAEPKAEFCKKCPLNPKVNEAGTCQEAVKDEEV